MFSNYRKAAEMINGSLAIVGLLVAVINNGLQSGLTQDLSKTLFFY